MEILSSVGRNGINRHNDVIVVQRLLKNLNYNVGVLDGLCGERTIHAIELFQRAFFGHIKPDGLVEPNKLTWKKLCGENLNTVEDTSLLTTLVDKPKKGAINVGLVAVDNVLMLSLLGNPRESYTEKDQPITNEALKRNMITSSVGPFKATGLSLAVESLRLVLEEVKREQPLVYGLLGSDGMKVCRLQRKSSKLISNHSRGIAIDITLNGKRDKCGDNKVLYGIALIAPIFCKHGWYWGAAFRKEDAMHFEASKTLVESWSKALGLGKK